MNILALHVDVSMVRAAVLDTNTGLPVGNVARTQYALDTPASEASEVPAQRLWQAVASAGRSAVIHSGVSGIPGRDVQAVGLSCFAPGLVLLDKKDQPLRPIWTNLDRRARVAARQVWNEVGQEFATATGNRPLPGIMSALSLREMYTRDPYLLHDIRSFLHINSWLGLHMTGQKGCDPGNACFTGLFNTLGDRQWSPRWCDYFEVAAAWLPPIIAADATLGTVRAEIAAELSVPTGIPCKLGTTTTATAALAANLQPGELLHELGNVQVLTVLTDKPAPTSRQLIHLQGVGRHYLASVHNPVGTPAIEWAHELCFRDQSLEDFLNKVVPAALDHCTRVTLDPPYLGGDSLEIDARRGAFRDLELITTRLDLLAALLKEMVDRHREAAASLTPNSRCGRVYLSGRGASLARRILPNYAAESVVELEDASLRGVARLFSDR